MKLKCHLCKEVISIKNEKYICIENFDEGKSIRKTYFHLNCWNESVGFHKQARGLLNRLRPMVNQLTGNNEVYDLK